MQIEEEKAAPLNINNDVWDQTSHVVDADTPKFNEDVAEDKESKEEEKNSDNSAGYFSSKDEP